MPNEDANQGFKQRTCLLVQSRKVAVDATQGGSATSLPSKIVTALLNS